MTVWMIRSQICQKHLTCKVFKNLSFIHGRGLFLRYFVCGRKFELQIWPGKKHGSIWRIYTNDLTSKLLPTNIKSTEMSTNTSISTRAERNENKNMFLFSLNFIFHIAHSWWFKKSLICVQNSIFRNMKNETSNNCQNLSEGGWATVWNPQPLFLSVCTRLTPL